MKRIVACLIAGIMLLCFLCSSLADSGDGNPLGFPKSLTPAQKQMKEIVYSANAALKEHDVPQVNSLFDCVDTFAVAGITVESNGEIPEDVEITFTFDENQITRVQITTSDFSLFAPLCSAFVAAASNISYDDAYTVAKKYADMAEQASSDSFEDNLITTQGNSLRCYYAYYPNQFSDNVNWLQMTAVFPLNYSGKEFDVMLTVPPNSNQVFIDSEGSQDYEGYSYDGNEFHLELFTSPTPEVDVDFSKK